MISLYDRDRIAWDFRPIGLGLYEGEAAVRVFVEEFLGTFEDYTAEVRDIEDIGDGRWMTFSDTLRRNSVRTAAADHGHRCRRVMGAARSLVAVWMGRTFHAPAD
jgi:hypothetical protein